MTGSGKRLPVCKDLRPLFDLTGVTQNLESFVLAAVSINDCFSRSTAEKDNTLLQQRSRCERTQRENHTHSLGSQPTSDRIGQMTEANPELTFDFGGSGGEPPFSAGAQSLVGIEKSSHSLPM